VLLMGIGFAMTLPLQVISYFLERSSSDPNAPVVAAIATFVLFALLVTPVVNAAITHAIGSVCLGYPVSFGESFQVGIQLFVKLIGTAILSTLAIAVGLLLFVIPGIYLMFALMLVYQVIVLERIAGVAALKRSRELTQGNLLRVFGVYVVGLLISVVLSAGVTLALTAVPALAHFGNAVVQAAMTAFLSAAYVLLYFDLRCRKEAFDIEHLTRIVEGGESGAVAPG